MLSDYHIHTYLCQHAAKDLPEEYVQSAIQQGFTEIGFADHAPKPSHFDERRMGMKDFPTYLQLINDVKKKFPGIAIRLGLECDFLSGCEPFTQKILSQASFDYVIGSVHHIFSTWEEPKWNVTSKQRSQGLWQKHSAEEILKEYFDCLAQAAQSGLYDIIGHPDVIRKHSPKAISPETLKRRCDQALDAIADCGLTMEVNTSSLSREGVQDFYPCREILEMALARNIPICLGSDAHAANEVGRNFHEAQNLLYSLGCQSLRRFCQRQPEDVPLTAISAATNAKNGSRTFPQGKGNSGIV